MFTENKSERTGAPLAWILSGSVVLVVIGVLVLLGRRQSAPAANSLQPLAPYAASLRVSQLAMSESTSLSGGKSTFIDGHIQNTGTQTVSGITVQVLFRNDEQLPPQIETLPLMLIRTHEPYVDLQTVSSNPLKPGEDREFRLIFEAVPENWNMQMPEIRVVRVATR